MESRPREVAEYKTADGASPFQEWLDGLRDVRARALIRKRLIRVRQGNLGEWRSVGDGVKEIKIAFGPGYRVYFGEDGDTLVVLLCGGDKGSQDADIKTAKKYWADYTR